MITLEPVLLPYARLYYYCPYHGQLGGFITITSDTSEIDLSGSAIYPQDNLEKRYNVTVFGPKKGINNKISYLKKNFLIPNSSQKYLLKCDVWVDNLKSSSFLQNGAIFIYKDNIKIIKSDTRGISDGNTIVYPFIKDLISDAQRWSSVSLEIELNEGSNSFTVVFVSFDSIVALDNDSLSLVKIDEKQINTNYGNAKHTLDFKEIVEIEVISDKKVDFVSNREINQQGGLITNTSIFNTDIEVAYQNITTDNSERGGTIYIDYKDNFTKDFSLFLNYLKEQLNEKSINRIKYIVEYNESTGFFSIKHASSTSQTSFYIRENYKYNPESKLNEIVYERVFRKVKTYFNFSKLTSIGPILGFVTNDTQFCSDTDVVTSKISFKNNYRRINMLRYISTVFGIEYTIGMRIDNDGIEKNRPLDNYKNSISDSNDNHSEGLIDVS